MKCVPKLLFSFINAFSKMKNLALLVFVLVQLAGMPCEALLEETGFCNMLPDIFARAALTYETPFTDVSDYDIESYHQEQVDLFHKYHMQTMQTICQEAEESGEELNKTVVEYGEKLQEAINAMRINKFEVIRIWNQLKEQLIIFLNMESGNAISEQPVFFSLKPLIPLPDIKTAAERSYDETFVTLPAVLHENYRTYLQLVEGIYHKGWEAVCSRYNEVQTVFRDKILNGFLLDTYKSIVDQIYDDEDLISDIVGDDEWEDFEFCGDEILDIYDEYREPERK